MIFGSRRNPKAPSFRRGKYIEKDLSGTMISFFAPASYSPFAVKQAGGEASTFDLFSADNFKVGSAADGSEIQGVRSVPVYTGSWAFSGMPFIHGCCGLVNSYFEVKRIDNLAVNESLFDNDTLASEVYKHLELTVVNDFDEPVLDDPFDLTQHSWPNFLAPINWQWLNREGIEWLYFENQSLADGPSSITWAAAISDRHYLACYFFVKRFAPNAGNPFRIEQRVSSDNFLAFMHKIMGSFKIELASSAKAERERVNARIPVQSRPVVSCTAEQITLAKQVLQHYSGHGYRGDIKDPKNGHRADPVEISDFIDERVKPKPLPGSYQNTPTLNEK